MAESSSRVLERFLESLAARNASPHTRRAYATAIGTYLAWLGEREVDWRSPSRPMLRAYLAVLGEGHARSSVAQRLAAVRALPPRAGRGGTGGGGPRGGNPPPPPPRRPPRRPPVPPGG